MPGERGKSSTVTITSLSDLGYGIAQKAGQTLSVARTSVGDQVQVGPADKPGKWSSAPLLRVVKPGPDRVDPPCEAFVRGCGGCQWLHLDYSSQHHWKEKNLLQLLRTRAGFSGSYSGLVSAATIEQPVPQGYRNKFSLKNDRHRFVLVPETGEHPLSPQTCFVQTRALQQAWEVLKSWTVPEGIDQVHLRSNDQGQVGVHAFVNDGAKGLDAHLGTLLKLLPQAVGIGATSRHGYRVVAGEGTLTQRIGELQWLVPHNGFFQTNSVMAERLLELVAKQAAAKGSDTILDLYCGTGFFGLAFAGNVQRVVGIEENPQAVLAARQSAQVSGLSQTEFHVGDLGTVLSGLPVSGHEIVVVDPPREGLLPGAVAALSARKPERIVYVSCYPPTLARDLKALVKEGWRTRSAGAVDMFPHTSHVEAVVTLTRN